MTKNKHYLILAGIFVFALALRFLWFPQNVYFGYDQSRDAFISQEIYRDGNIKIIGPSASGEGLFHGPLYWYLVGPVYLLAQGNPAIVLAFITILNALGIFLVYFLAVTLFGQRKFGYLSAIIYAFSFSQTQYSLYFANPAPAILTITAFYLGWALLLKGKSWAWLLVGLGLGLSIQLEFFLIYMSASALIAFVLFFKNVKQTLNVKGMSLFIAGLVVSLSTFIIAEFKYGFRTTLTLLKTFTPDKSSTVHLASSSFIGRLGDDLSYLFITVTSDFRIVLVLFLGFAFIWAAYRDKTTKRPILLLLLWIVSNLLVDLFGPPQLYYVNIGVSVALIIFTGYFLGRFVLKKWLVFLILLGMFTNSFILMRRHNPRGPINTLYVQENMLLTDETKVLDWIYQEAAGKPFVVNVLTMPYKIKTTWAYSFTWYGQSKYQYVPYWGGEDVPGYPGEMPHYSGTNKLPRYAIYEPTRGIPENLQKDFTDSENGFGLPVKQVKIGAFTVEKRVP